MAAWAGWGCPRGPIAEPEPVHVWLHCEDCAPRTRLRVVAAGDRDIPAFRRTLLDGPPREHLANIRRQVAADYRSLPVAARPEPESAFVARYTASFVILVRTRSAMALGEIGGPGAVEALDLLLARGDTVPGPVRRAASVARALNDPSQLGAAAAGLGAVGVRVDTAPGFDRSVDIANPPYPRVLFALSIDNAGRDAVATFTARPRERLPGTVSVDWRGDGRISLLTRDCAPTAGPDSTGVVRPGAGRLVEAHVDIAAGGCLDITVRYRARQGSRASVSLQVVPERAP